MQAVPAAGPCAWLRAQRVLISCCSSLTAAVQDVICVMCQGCGVPCGIACRQVISIMQVFEPLNEFLKAAFSGYHTGKAASPSVWATTMVHTNTSTMTSREPSTSGSSCQRVLRVMGVTFTHCLCKSWWLAGVGDLPGRQWTHKLSLLLPLSPSQLLSWSQPHSAVHSAVIPTHRAVAKHMHRFRVAAVMY